MDRLTRLIEATDHLRGPPLVDASVPYKEWFHFCVLAPGLHLLVNFSLAADLRPAAPRGARLARLLMLACADRWSGGVETFADREVRAAPGAIDLAFGSNRLTFTGGAFRLEARIERGPIAARIELRPLAVPLVGLDADLGGGKLSWVVVPVLRARGVVVVDGRRHVLADAPAYHDHNWGAWRWGQDFAWQWGFALPRASRDPGHAVVLSRLTNRARTRDLDTKLCLWKDDLLVRVFHGREVDIVPEGHALDLPTTSVPPLMALLSPGAASDVPARLRVRAARGDDELRFRFDARSVARILVPNEVDLGVTTIHEVAGALRIDGHLGAEPLALEGDGVFEHLEIT